MPSQTFSFTGAEQTWQVPNGVDVVTVQANGAGGGDDDTGTGGTGGYAEGDLAVTAGDTLYIYVGGVGANAGSAGGDGTGGWPNGGDSIEGSSYGGGGGGSSDLRHGGNALADRVIVGAGAGGAGNGFDVNGGDGGGLQGQDGGYWRSSAYRGLGGDQSSGGAGGDHGGGSGSLSTGGAGGQDSSQPAGVGGAGGGGYYGGGGGGSYDPDPGASNDAEQGGGGGGSSYVGGVTSTTTTTGGGNAGDGTLVIVYAETAPTNLSVSSVTQSSISLDWDAPSPDTSLQEYRAYRSTSPGVTTANTQVGTISPGTTTFTDSGLSDLTTYYYAVAAVYSTGSELSNETSGQTAYNGPQNLTVNTTDQTNDLSWDPPTLDAGDSVDQYRIYRATTSGGAVTGDYTQIATVPGGTMTYSDSGLAEGETYYYRITADVEVDQQ